MGVSGQVSSPRIAASQSLQTLLNVLLGEREASDVIEEVSSKRFAASRRAHRRTAIAEVSSPSCSDAALSLMRQAYAAASRYV